MDRAYAVVEIKEIDEEQRVIKGMATTPTTDRMGDVVEPTGVQSGVDIPLFLYHDSTQTVGRARMGKATKQGVPFEASLPKVKEAGRLKDRVDEAWQMLKYRLITGVSIGFRALQDQVEPIKGGGLRFLSTEVLELSLVPIPANAEATITSVKSLSERVTSDLTPPATDHLPGVSGAKAQKGIPLETRKVSTMKTINEQIAALEASRQAKAARMGEIMQKAMAEGRSTEAEEATEYDEISAEVKRFDQDLVRLRDLEKLNISQAKAVDQQPGAMRGAPSIIVKRDQDEKFKGQNYTRMVIAKAVARMEDTSATNVAMRRWGKSNPTVVEIIKANEVAGGGSGSGEWGAELVQADARYTGDFIEYLYSRTVYDRLGLREVPANITIKGQDGAATGYWVGESKPIPATTVDFSTVNLTPLKVAALAVVSNELLRDSSPSAEMLVRDALVEASAQRVDTTFLSTSAAVAGVSPAGILNGLVGGTPAGTDADSLRADIKTLYAGFITAKNATGLTMVMHPSLAKSVQLMVNALGQPEFAAAMMTGGTLLGDPLVTGDNVGATHFILLKPSDIYRIGDTGVQVSISRDAMIEQSTVPTGATDTPVAASQAFTSMFQAESTAIKVVRSINFAKRRASAVAYMTGAAYA